MDGSKIDLGGCSQLGCVMVIQSTIKSTSKYTSALAITTAATRGSSDVKALPQIFDVHRHFLGESKGRRDVFFTLLSKWRFLPLKLFYQFFELGQLIFSEVGRFPEPVRGLTRRWDANTNLSSCKTKLTRFHYRTWGGYLHIPRWPCCNARIKPYFGSVSRIRQAIIGCQVEETDEAKVCV